MGKIRNHFIGRQFIEVSMHDKTDAFQFRNKLADVCKYNLIPEMEKLFDREIPGDKILRIDKIELDINVSDVKNWESEFIEKSLLELGRILRQQTNFSNTEAAAEIIDEQKNIEERMIFFLETGRLPWHSQDVSIQDDFRELMLVESFREKFFRLMKANSNAFQRFVFQIEKENLKNALEAFTEKEHNYVFYKRIKELLSEDAQIIEPTKLELLKSYLDKSKPEIKNDLTKEEDEISIEEDKPDNEKKITDEAHYINNAGLVILHPFLERLFENTGYIEKGNWRNESIKQRASALTQYMVTGTELYAEREMMLNKILCGYDLLKSIPIDLKLSEFEKEEANDLLLSVIDHWKALKNTGADGLRNTFLMREGKLYKKDDQWKLQIERRTEDLLIDRLPWGISFIKLPWVKEHISVEW